MPNQFLSPEGDIENYFVSEYWLIDQYIGDELWTWGTNYTSQLGTNDTNTWRVTPVTTFAGGTNWKQVSSGRFHSAAIKTDGTLWTWGRPNDGELGNANITNRSTPVTTFAGGTDWKQVSTGSGNTAAIKVDGTLWTWGYADHIGINDGIDRSTPITTFVGGSDWKQVSAGWFHVLAVKTDGTLWSWGDNDNGQLGNGLDRSIDYYRLTPVTTFAGGNNWADTATTEPEDLYTLGAGNLHTVAIKTDGTLWTWGSGSYLGINDRFVKPTPVTTFAGGTNWKQVSSGNSNTAAIKTDGTLWTWGTGSSGELGTNDTTFRSTPITTFTGGTNWKQVSSGGNHTAAIKTDGTLWTWGDRGLLGIINSIPSSTNISTPVTTFVGGNNWADAPTAEPEDLYTLSAGYRIAAAIKTDGTLLTWGYSNFGQLGTNSTTNRSFPGVTFAGGTNWKQVSAGRSHMSAIKTDGTLWSWGYQGSGRLGNAVILTQSVLTPITTFAGGTNWKQVSTLWRNGAAIKTDGTLWTWGSGISGVLGNAVTSGNISTPVTTFAGGTNWKQVSVGGYASFNNGHMAAIKTDGTLWVWGINNAFGGAQLGTNDNISKSTPVTTFAGGTDWKQVSCGEIHTAAVKTDGTLWIWGNGNLGQLGNAVLSDRTTPVTTFAGGTNWKQVSVNRFQTAAIKTDGTLWTWGWGSNGKLGNADLTNKSTPVTTFAGGTNWKQVSVGHNHTLALRDDGVNKELFVFGLSNFLGLDLNPNIPSSLLGTNWKQVSAGSQHTSAIKTDGTLWTWGYGFGGRLGNADLTNRSTPVTTFAGGINWKQVSAGGQHISAIKTDGTLWTWGRNLYGELGNGYILTFRSTPITTFAGGTNWKQVTAGNTVTAAIKTDGTLWTWGNNSSTGSVSPSLGTNDTTNRSTPVTTFAGGTNWKQVHSSGETTIALRDDGVNKEIYVFGNSVLGQLGINLFENNNVPNKIGNSSDWKQAAGGRLHSAAIKTDGTLWTWGFNGFSGGVLGINSGSTSLNAFTPVTTFAGGTDWKSINCGANHNIAIKTDGTLWTWGNGDYGQLGIGEVTFKKTPVTTFAGGNNWADTATTDPEDLYTFFASDAHAVAIKTDGTLWTWGENSRFNGPLLATNDTEDKPTPVTTFAGGTNWKQVSCSIIHTAAIKTDGTLWVWGNNSAGFSGPIIGTNDNQFKTTPVTTFAGGTNWKQISVGQSNTAAIKTDGTLWIWGTGYSGQLGNAVFQAASTPITTFAGGTNWKQISCGTSHIAAIKTDGTLWSWGTSSSGRLGNTITTGSVSTPITTFAGGTDWKQVSCGEIHTAAIKTDGTLWVWGSGSSGNGILGLISTPVTTFAGGTNWKQVSAGGQHTAAIKTDGTLWTWGSNYFGNLGNNSVVNVSTPVTTFAGGTNWKQVIAGNDITIALKDDGVNKELFIFGDNSSGYTLGIGVRVSARPSKVGNSTDWKQSDGGYGTTAAIKIDGTLWTWGYNTDGALGTNDQDGYDIRKYTPVTTFAGGNNWRQVSFGRNSAHAVKTGIIPDLPLS